MTVPSITPVELDALDFTPYGRIVRLHEGGPDVITSRGDGWSGVFSAEPLVDGAGSLGYTVGEPLPYEVTQMERHHHTPEALFCQAGPVALPLAAPGSSVPLADEVIAVVLRPGDLVVLDPGVWHDACHGIEKATPYYWFAVCDPAIVDPWVEIAGGPVTVNLPES